jgi:hypothetical protein
MQLIFCGDCQEYESHPIGPYHAWFYKGGHADHNQGTCYDIVTAPVKTKRPLTSEQAVWLNTVLSNML